MIEASDMAAMISSRICHDLISPIGAIGNGVELLEMSGRAEPEVALIGDSVGNASTLIQMFRLAFGSAGDQTVPEREPRDILNGLSARGRTEYSWNAGQTPRKQAKAALLLVMCAEHALAYGGKIAVDRTGKGLAVKATADRLIAQENLWQSLASGVEPAEFGAATIQFVLAPSAIAEAGGDLRVKLSDREIAASF